MVPWKRENAFFFFFFNEYETPCVYIHSLMVGEIRNSKTIESKLNYLLVTQIRSPLAHHSFHGASPFCFNQNIQRNIRRIKNTLYVHFNQFQ